MLYREITPDKFIPWDKKPINGVALPRNFGSLKLVDGSFAHSDAELRVHDLCRPKDASPLDAGRVLVSRSVQRVGGVVKYVNVTDAKPAPSTDPRDYELSPAQFEYLLVDSELDDALETAKSSTKAARSNSPADKEAEALFKMALKGRSFNFDKTLGLIASLAAHTPADANLGETELTQFWLKAAAK